MNQNPVPLCRDCRWLVPNKSDITLSKCSSPGIERRLNLVNGEQQPIGMVFAENRRKYEREGCGPQGLEFQAKSVDEVVAESPNAARAPWYKRIFD